MWHICRYIISSNFQSSNFVRCKNTNKCLSIREKVKVVDRNKDGYLPFLTAL